MSLRIKIVALACLLLTAFAVTTALSARLIREAMDEMGGIVDYHIALTGFVSDIDVLTFKYELNLRRLIDQRLADADQLRLAAERQKAVADQLREDFTKAHALVQRAVRDERNDLSDRIELARVEAVLDLLGRQVEPFVKVGTGAMQAVEAQRFDEANRLAEGFTTFTRGGWPGHQRGTRGARDRRQVHR